jgi:hypothetical protein
VNRHNTIKLENDGGRNLFLADYALEFHTLPAYIPLQFMERTRGEIILFAAAVFGVWISVWAVILVSKWLEATSLLITLGALAGFALRDEN